MSRGVDVLTLSATPIPRTLNMALSGVRDMSTIEEPPQDRQPVQTYVMEHDWGVISDAIRRELSRGGQVYYLHNRVDNIDRTAAKIALHELLEGVSRRRGPRPDGRGRAELRHGAHGRGATCRCLSAPR
jgi:transcription-repair coupling factor (superfamily II helicase)